MSRAFGDYCLKDFGLISVPEVTRRQISVRDQFIVLASDGVCIIVFVILCLQNGHLLSQYIPCSHLLTMYIDYLDKQTNKLEIN